METNGAPPGDPGEAEPAKLLLKPSGSATCPADWGQTKRADEVVGGSAQMDLRALGPKSFRGQVGKNESWIGTVGKTDRARRFHAEGEAAIDSIDSVSAGTAVGKGRQDQDAGPEADGRWLDLEAPAQSSRGPQILASVPESVSHS